MMRRANLPLWILVGCLVFVFLFVAVNHFVGKSTLSGGELVGGRGALGKTRSAAHDSASTR